MKTFPASFFRAAFSLAATLLFTGCVGLLPRPVSTTKVDWVKTLPDHSRPMLASNE